MSTESEARLQRLIDLAEIKDLPLRYALLIDTRNLDGFPDLWAERDTPAEFPELDAHTFESGVDRFFRSSTASVHFVGNHLVEFDDEDHARGHVYCWAQTDRKTVWVEQTLLYQDRYVRCPDGKWRFDTRRHLLWYGTAAKEHPRRQGPMNWPHGKIDGDGSFGRGSLPEGFATYREFWGLKPGETVDGQPAGEGDAV
ncbi:MAG: nuclear transport factor 2 family protein [Solirubrobacteraceae bacterium]|nr:nuclear transport factor 2 family protein [Patulibacter sp.]